MRICRQQDRLTCVTQKERWGVTVFKLVIVEDEDNIRHSLECFIPWASMGFKVVGTFCDGSSALAYIKENPCDVVLTDILMSRMSGLEMICQLHQIYPEIKVVILSGHSDFAYAQQAIEYQVVHYLVKPVDEDELMDVFKGIREQLDLEQEVQDAADSENRDVKQILQKTFFRDLLAGRVTSDSELGVYLKLLDFEESDKTCALVAFEIQEEKNKSDETALEIGNASLEESFDHYFGLGSDDLRVFLIEERADKWCAVFVDAAQREITTLRKCCTRKMQDFADGLNGSVSFRLTHLVVHISDLLAGGKNPQTVLSQQGMDSALRQTVASDYKLLIVELDLGSKDTILHILNALLLEMESVPLEEARFVLKNLYSIIELNYKKRKINVWDLTNCQFSVNHLYDAEDMDSVAQRTRADFCSLCDGLRNRRQTNDHSVVMQVRQFLLENIDKDFSHDVLAAKYRVHPGYLSRLFKQDMGETLSEYVLRIKIERAAALLKEGRYKIGDIAGMVGYSASSYFSIAFKKFTGCSPREYSQRVLL